LRGCNKKWSSAKEKEKFRISSGNLAVQWHSCNFVYSQISG
jgi:hypothetical protein